MLFKYSDLVMAKYIVKLLALVDLMLYLNVLPLLLKLPSLCFIPDVIAMFAEFSSIPMIYVPERCCVAVWFLYLVLKSFSVRPLYVSVVLWSLRVMVAWEITDFH